MAALPDGRSAPRIALSRLFDAVFLGCACQGTVPIARDTDPADAQSVHVETFIVGPGIGCFVVGNIEADRKSLIAFWLKVCTHRGARLTARARRFRDTFSVELLNAASRSSEWQPCWRMKACGSPNAASTLG